MLDQCFLPVDIRGPCGAVRYAKRLRRHVADCSAFLFDVLLGHPLDAVVKSGKAKICKLERKERNGGRKKLREERNVFYKDLMVVTLIKLCFLQSQGHLVVPSVCV